MSYYANGGFDSIEQLVLFHSKDFSQQYFLLRAENYSDRILPIKQMVETQSTVVGNQSQIVVFLHMMRNEISLGNLTVANKAKGKSPDRSIVSFELQHFFHPAAKYWFDNITDYMSILTEIQNNLESGLDVRIAANRQRDMVGLFVVVFFLIIVIACFPFIVWSTRRTSSTSR